MGASVGDFLGRLFGRNKPPSTPVEQPSTPVDVPPVEPEPPVVYQTLFHHSLHLWCEAHGADRYDGVAMSNNVFVHAIRGMSKQARTIRSIHPWYDPFKKSPSDNQMKAWFNEAKLSGCAAISIDWEGWLNSVAETERVMAIADLVGIKVIFVPKWTLDPSGSFYCGKKSKKEVVELLNSLAVPAVLPWIYGGDSNWRVATIKSIYRDNGYSGQVIGMTDGGMREGQSGYNTVAETLEFMARQAAAGESVGLFNNGYDTKAFKYALSLYK